MLYRHCTVHQLGRPEEQCWPQRDGYFPKAAGQFDRTEAAIQFLTSNCVTSDELSRYFSCALLGWSAACKLL